MGRATPSSDCGGGGWLPAFPVALPSCPPPGFRFFPASVLLRSTKGPETCKKIPSLPWGQILVGLGTKMRTKSGLHRRGELRLIERAIVQGWPVPSEQRKKAADLAVEVIRDETANERETLTAIRVLVRMGQANREASSHGRV